MELCARFLGLNIVSKSSKSNRLIEIGHDLRCAASELCPDGQDFAEEIVASIPLNCVLLS